MSKTQQLKIEIISVIDRLPLDGLKLLAEFVEFLQSKFRLTAPKPTNTVPKIAARPSSRSELWHKIETLEQQHPNLSPQNKQALALLKAASEQPDDKGDAWWDDFEAELRQNRLTFPERDIL